jgi:HEAT repeat protein
VRNGAASALGEVGGEKALALLEKALVDQDVNVRSVAASALGNIGGEKALALLEKALADQDAKVRNAAAYPLAYIGGEEARDLLLGTLTGEKDRGVLTAVRDALKSTFANDPAVVKALKDLKLPEDPESQPPSKPEPASDF